MKNLYIDFDGVIVNTIEVSYKMAEERNIKKNYENYLQFYQTLNWEEVLKKSKPINDSFNCIQKIIDSNKFNVSILTHITSIHEGEAKVSLIRKYFKDITVILVPKTLSKTKMVKTKDSILIDDFPHNLIEWQENGGISIRFDLDMDGKGFPVIKSLDEVLKMF
jgi:hypothetical protein